jgi:hypothetical protein
MMQNAQLRFAGQLAFLGRNCQIDLSLNVDRSQLVNALLDLLQMPDDVGLDIEAAESMKFNFLQAEIYLEAEEDDITPDDLANATNQDELWSLLCQKYPSLSVTKPKTTKLTQLEQDFEKIKPHLTELIQDGQFVYGHQSIIARLLSGSNEGNFRKKRVLPMEKLLVELYISTSTTSTIVSNYGKNSDDRLVA